MKTGFGYQGFAVLALAWAVSAIGQVAPAIVPQAPVLPAMQEMRPGAGAVELPSQTGAGVPSFLRDPQAADTPGVVADENVQRLLAFRDADVKFNVAELMEILRDTRHEGWVLAAYPDPKTGHPLIGAGFTLDLPARAHIQTDPENPHPFMEPSSAELWQAAGLDSVQLRTILEQFDGRLAAWNKRGFRNRMTTLTRQISDEDAEQLLRVAIIQSAYNAKAYCRSFDRLSALQQMALTQLVYQMGYNLQEFSSFLALMNNNAPVAETGTEVAGAGAAEAMPVAARDDVAGDSEYWLSVQKSLVQSQWARLYRARAVAVIAMLDPVYGVGPRAAEMRVSAMLRPAVVRGRRHGGAVQRRVAGKSSRVRKSRQRKRGV